MKASTAISPAPPKWRTVVGGVLMGLANLVPGVSGGTMVLVVGLYDEFIASVADASRLRFTRRNATFLAVLGGSAGVAIAMLAGVLGRAVTDHRGAMFSLFIGLTLGGAPTLWRMIHKRSAPAMIGLVLGLAIMCAIASSGGAPDSHDRAHGGDEGFVVQENYTRDVVAGALGMSAMVMPGISGAYMLLIVGRYETILASIDLAKDYVRSFGSQGDPWVFLKVLIPTAVGSLASLVLLSNFLKWMLRRHAQVTLGFLLGVLLGSVVGIWPFNSASQSSDYMQGVLLATVGLASTLGLSRIGGPSRAS